MLSPAEIAKIRVDIERLERARDECRDNSIRELIEDWIKEQKKKLDPEQPER